MSDEKTTPSEEEKKPTETSSEQNQNSSQESNSSNEKETNDGIEKAMLAESEAVAEGKKKDPDMPEGASEEDIAEKEAKDEEKKKSASEKDVKEDTKKSDGDEDEGEDEEEIESSDDEEADEHDEEEESKDYSTFSKKQLIAEFKNLLQNKPVQKIKNDVDEIRNEFNNQFQELQDQKKEEFLAEGGNIIDFHFTTPLKKEFNSLYFDYKEKRNNYYKSLKKDLHANLKKREELIEELKGLLNAEENINSTYNHFKDIQERWHTAGPIPRDKYNLTWNTYRHHVENFYDFLHLNREFRDLDFKHNLEQKIRLITRAEELAQEKNMNKAFRELQMLHKMWKEDVGPVAKEYRDEVWEKFSAATKIIHDKRSEYLKEQEKEYEANVGKKEELISQIQQYAESTKDNHHAWQNAIKKVQELRDQFFALGRVPRSENKRIWNAFKDATRTFNRTKNAFYKNQKKQQYENLEKKRELVKIAEENRDSDDFDAVTPLMKKIQSDWKKIGHVPRKHSDKLWKQFKAACNNYFDRLHAKQDKAKEGEKENLQEKEAFLETLSNLELSGDHDKDLALLKEKISEWKKMGRVPYKKRDIEKTFNKKLDELFSKLDVGKKEAELIKFDNKLNTLANREDERKLKNEHFFISKKIEETKGEIRQLENNLGFFQHVDDDNPLVKEVHKNIARHKEQLEVWKAKLKKIKSVRDV
ncbi:DUF349 domain-containing protein [Luteirhabdus pelagi]|uniref:DUF349 domain-containing protein n=1 Tax=Luteirhabdus pelagi TaxID=2792783 RepID=UPI00193977B8|nr:DUF349 domain-containing protein [Luteirhabdus pelagi]